MAQDSFPRLAQRVEPRISCERQPGVCEAPPQAVDPVQLRSIRGHILDDPSLLLPVREWGCNVFTRMKRGMVYAHHRLVRERWTKGSTTGEHHAGVAGACKQPGRPGVLALPNPEPLAPLRLPGRQCDDALGLLPRLGTRGSKPKARGIPIIQSEWALVCLGRQRFQGTGGLGTGVRGAAALPRLAHALPSTPGLCGQALQRRQTAALVGGVGEARQDLCERLGGFLEIWQSEVPFLRAAWARSTPARLIRHTLGAMLFPGLEPGRHGDALALRGLGARLDRRAVGTQSQTMGAAPGSQGGGVLHRGCSALTLFLGQRLPLSHEHSLIRLSARSHAKRCSVDEIEERHCVKKLLV